jgi:hypothetical protein
VGAILAAWNGVVESGVCSFPRHGHCNRPQPSLPVLSLVVCDLYGVFCAACPATLSPLRGRRYRQHQRLCLPICCARGKTCVLILQKYDFSLTSLDACAGTMDPRSRRDSDYGTDRRKRGYLGDPPADRTMRPRVGPVATYPRRDGTPPGSTYGGGLCWDSRRGGGEGRGDPARGYGGNGRRGEVGNTIGGGGRGGVVRAGLPANKFILENGRGLEKGKGGETIGEENVDKIFNSIIMRCGKDFGIIGGIKKLCSLLTDHNIRNLNVIHVSCAIDTLGKLALQGVKQRDLPPTFERILDALTEHVLLILHDFEENHRALSQVLHGLALVHGAGLSQVAGKMVLKDALFQHCNHVMHYFSPLEMAVVLLNLSKLGWFRSSSDFEILSKIDAACCDICDRATQDTKFGCVDITNILQALNYIHNSCSWRASNGLLHRLETHAGSEAYYLEPQGVVTTVSNLAKLERDPDDEIKAKLCLQALKVMHTANHQDVSQFLWSMAKLKWQPPGCLLDVLYQRMKTIRNSFNLQEMVTIFWASAELNVRLGPKMEIWECMMDSILENSYKFHLNAQDMSMFFHALGLFGHMPGEKIRPLLKLLPRAMADGTPQNVTQVFRALAILEGDMGMDVVTPELLEVLSNRAYALINSFNGQDLSGLYYSFATLKRRPDPQLMHRMSQHVDKIQRDLNAQDVATIAWAIHAGRWNQSDAEDDEQDEQDLITGRRGGPRGVLDAGINSVYDPIIAMRALAERSQDIMDTFLPRDFANIFMTVSRLCQRSTDYNDFFISLCDGLSEQAHDMRDGGKGPLDPRDIAQILHAMSSNHAYLDDPTTYSSNGSGRQRFQALLKVLSDICFDYIPQFNAADLSDVLNATVHLEFSGSVQSDLMNKLMLRSYDVSAQLDGKCLSELVWAIQRTGRELTHDFLHIISTRALELLGEGSTASSDVFRPRDIAVLMWALAKLQVRPSAHLRMRLVSYVTVNVERFKPCFVAHILWATAVTWPEKAAPDSPEWQAEKDFRKIIMRRLVDCVEHLKTSEVTTVMWALVVMSVEIDWNDGGCVSGDFRKAVDRLALRVESTFRSMQKKEGEGNGNGEAPRAVSPRSARDRVEHEFDRSDMCMLHQFFLSYTFDPLFASAIGGHDCSLHRVHKLYAPRCKTAFDDTLSSASDMQKRVSNVLKHMKLEVENEFRCKDSGYSIDLLVSLSLSRARSLSLVRSNYSCTRPES